MQYIDLAKFKSGAPDCNKLTIKKTKKKDFFSLTQKLKNNHFLACNYSACGFTIFSGAKNKHELSQRRSRKKRNNASGINLRGNFAIVRTPSVSLRAITWLEPTIQSKTSIWAAVNFHKTLDIDEL